MTEIRDKEIAYFKELLEHYQKQSKIDRAAVKRLKGMIKSLEDNENHL